MADKRICPDCQRPYLYDQAPEPDEELCFALELSKGDERCVLICRDLLRAKLSASEAECERLRRELAEAHWEVGLYALNDHPISLETWLHQSRESLDLAEMIRGGETTQQELERLRREVEELRSAARVVVNADTYVDRSRSRAEAVSEAICKLEKLLPEPEPRCAAVEYLEKERKDG